MTGEADGETGRPEEVGAADGALPALPVIQRFGGIRPMAQKLGVPVSTVQGWKERGAIPANRREEVLAAAARHDIAWEPGDLSPPAIPPVSEITGDAQARAGAAMAPEGQAVHGPASETSPWTGVVQVEEQTGGPEVASSREQGETNTATAPAPSRSSLVSAAFVSALVALLISASAPWWTGWVGLAPQVQTPDAKGSSDTATLERRIAELESRPAVADPEFTARIETLEQLGGELRGELDRLGAGAAAPSEGTPAMEGRLEALQGQVAELRAELDGIRRDGAQAGTPERLIALTNRIEENAAELRAMQGELSRLIELPKRVQDLGATIEAASGQTQSTAFVLASGQLEAALDSGQPYASELGAVRRLAGGDAELPALLAALEEHADEGIASMAELRIRFDDTALAVAQAAQSDVGGDWMDRAWARLRSLVTVRPVGGDVAGDSPEARLARAEARLNEGDLASAVAELEVLEGAAAEAAAPWLAGARARVAADRAIEHLRERALARVLPDGAIE